MIVHISMAKYKDSAENRSKEENIQIAKALTESLVEKTGSILKIEVGIDILHREGDYDVVSYSEYADMDAVRKTVTHPAHDELVAVLQKVTEVSHSVTFERKS
jgi:hypothetical protein